MEEESFEMGSEKRYLWATQRQGERETRKIQEHEQSLKAGKPGFVQQGAGTAGLSEVCQGQKRQEIRLKEGTEADSANAPD